MLDVAYEMPVAADDPEDTRGLSLLCCGPNPFRSTTALGFVLPTPGVTHLTVYDVAGRRVAKLVEGMLPAGGHRVLWDGRAGSRPAPAGVYWVRLEWNGRARSQRLVHLAR